MSEPFAIKLNEEGLSRRQIQVSLKLREIAQDFFQVESSGLSLITVTRATISPDFRNGTIYITVLPESKEQAALDFARRQRSNLRTKIKKNLQMKAIPFVEIEIDLGEKNRQHIDELLIADKIERGGKKETVELFEEEGEETPSEKIEEDREAAALD